MHDHRQREGSLEPDDGTPASRDDGSTGKPSSGKPSGGHPLGSAAFYLVLAAAAFLLWQMVTGNAAGPC